MSDRFCRAQCPSSILDNFQTTPETRARRAKQSPQVNSCPFFPRRSSDSKRKETNDYCTHRKGSYLYVKSVLCAEWKKVYRLLENLILILYEPNNNLDDIWYEGIIRSETVWPLLFQSPGHYIVWHLYGSLGSLLLLRFSVSNPENKEIECIIRVGLVFTSRSSWEKSALLRWRRLIDMLQGQIPLICRLQVESG